MRPYHHDATRAVHLQARILEEPEIHPVKPHVDASRQIPEAHVATLLRAVPRVPSPISILASKLPRIELYAEHFPDRILH